MNPSDIVITGLGLVTPVGNDVASSLAAIQAGISAFEETDDVLVPCSAEGFFHDVATVARVQLFGEMKWGPEKAVGLLSQVIGECLHQADWHPQFSDRTLVMVDNLVQPAKTDFPTLVSALRVDYPELVHFQPESDTAEHCTFLMRIIEATALLREDKADFVLIGIVDSLAESEALDRLSDAGLLKSSINPEGIIPGEAAGAVLLERAEKAIQRGRRPLASLLGWGQAPEPRPWYGEKPCKAEGLTQALRECVENLPLQGQEIRVIFSDLNGERERSREWAMAYPRIFKDELERPLIHPADCVGDCGGAMGALLVALGSREREISLVTDSNILMKCATIVSLFPS